MGRKNWSDRAALAVVLLLSVCGTAVGAGAGLVGTLDVETDPKGMRIYVDGELRGTSPCRIEFVAIGTVEVKAEMEGLSTAKEIVEVRRNQVTKVTLELQELADVGHLEIFVEPEGSVVYLDRIPRGKTPQRLINVKAGTHFLKVSHEGYRPLYLDVVVVSGRDTVIRRKLTRIGRIGVDPGTIDQKDFDPEINVEDAPSIDDMPEAEAFEPVRKLLARREYDDALELLDEMAQDDETRKYMVRIARDKRFIQAVKPVIERGYEALKTKVGQRYPLLLTGNIVVEGTILRVTDNYVDIDLHGTGQGTQIDVRRVHVDRIIRLASRVLAPDEPASQAVFAVAYAMEESFPEAYEALWRAAMARHDITEAKAYVDSAKLWKAARLRDELERRIGERRRTEEERRKAEAAKEASKPLVLIDRHRGGWADQKVTVPLEKVGFRIRGLGRSITDDDLKDAAVLLILDPGPEARVEPYDERDVARVVKFVNSGGGFVFIGSCRVRYGGQGKYRRLVPVPSPFSPLLDQFGITVRSDKLTVSGRAPRELPRDYASAVPVQKGHPVTAGLRGVRFSTQTSSVAGVRRSWLLTTNRYVESTATGRGPTILAAARPVGEGRIVVLGGMPDMSEQAMRSSIRLIVNIMRWASLPKVQAARAAQ